MKMRIARVRVFEDILSFCEKFYIRRVAGKTNILLYIDVAMLLYIYIVDIFDRFASISI